MTWPCFCVVLLWVNGMFACADGVCYDQFISQSVQYIVLDKIQLGLSVQNCVGTKSDQNKSWNETTSAVAFYLKRQSYKSFN